ncbi:hypothetical protein [Streptomyces sp. NPDC007264]|uniref:hypothetical protein n=1 Tax=Streptomyces sp. NPDC007264 TaxID=3364777 RepID=UPI0036DAF976
MTTRSDEGPEFGPDDPLAVILRPPSDHLGPPAGRYEAVRRAAARRRLLRAAAGLGLSCAVAAGVALQLHLAAPGTPVRPTGPLAPPSPSRHTAPPVPSARPVPSVPHQRATARPGPRNTAPTRPVPTAVPTGLPSRTATAPRTEPSASRTGMPAASESSPRS